MRRLAFVILVSSLLLTLTLVQKGNIPPVKAFSSIYQGDLILTVNNVTTIEGVFDINGSIIVEDNATLILRNAVLNFPQVEAWQFSMTFRNPANGNPRLLVENSTLDSNGYWLKINLRGNSSATVDELTTNAEVQLILHDFSLVSVLNSTIGYVETYQFSTFTSSNSSFKTVIGDSDSMVTLSNCTLATARASDKSDMTIADCSITYSMEIVSWSSNVSVIGHKPGFVRYWVFEENCSIVTEPSYSKVPKVRLENVQVEGWSFRSLGNTNTVIYNSELCSLMSDHSATIFVYDSTISEGMYIWGSSHCYVYDTTLYFRSFEDSRVWLINSTYSGYWVKAQSEAYVSWYLDVHIIDSVGQDVPSVNVTATHLNGTFAESKFTDPEGWARLTLMEKMVNATDEYPVGNYTVEATYEFYSDDTAVNMTENRQITLTLEGFVIPEFPSFLILPLFMIITLLAVILCRRRQSMGVV